MEIQRSHQQGLEPMHRPSLPEAGALQPPTVGFGVDEIIAIPASEPAEVVHNRTIVREAPPLGEALQANRLNLLGDREVTSRAILHLMTEAVIDLSGADSDRQPLVLAARFGTAPETSLARMLEPVGYTLNEGNVLDEGGLLSYLTPEEFGDVIAETLAQGDFPTILLYTDTIQKVIGALTQEGAPAPSFEKIRDGVLLLGGARSDGEHKEVDLEADEVLRVRQAIPLGVQEADAQSVRTLGRVMQKMSNGKSVSPDSPPVDPEGVHVLDVRAEGVTGPQRGIQKSLLVKAILPIIHRQKPELVVITDIDHANPDEMSEVLSACNRNDIPVVAAFERLTQDLAPIAAGGIYGIATTDVRQAECAIELIPRTVQDKVEGFSWGVSTNRGRSEDKGVSTNHEGLTQFPGSGGRSGSQGQSYGDGLNVGFNASRGVSPVMEVTDLQNIARGQIALIPPDGQGPIMMYDATSGRAVEVFTPRAHKNPDRVAQAMAGILGKLDEPRPSRIPLAELPKREPPVLKEPYQRRIHWDRAYKKSLRQKVHKLSYPDWMAHVYSKEATNLSWEEWVEHNGGL